MLKRIMAVVMPALVLPCIAVIAQPPAMPPAIRVTGEAADRKIAPLVLLPFVENCFKHGASEELQQSWVKVSIDVINRGRVAGARARRALRRRQGGRRPVALLAYRQAGSA